MTRIPTTATAAFLLALAIPSQGALISFSDPTGDTFGSPLVSHDIVSIQTNATATQIAFTVTFAGDIAPASADPVDLNVTGFIDNDTDQDADTGAESNQTYFSGIASGLGIEYFIDLGLEMLGQVPVVNTSTGFDAGLAPVVFSSRALTVTVPTSLLGGDNGNVNYGVIVGDFLDASDQATNRDLATNPDLIVAYSQVDSTPPTTVVPEPASLAAWSPLILGLLFAHRRRRIKKGPETKAPPF